MAYDNNNHLVAYGSAVYAGLRSTASPPPHNDLMAPPGLENPGWPHTQSGTSARMTTTDQQLDVLLPLLTVFHAPGPLSLSPKNSHPRGSWPRFSRTEFKMAREQKQTPQCSLRSRPAIHTTSLLPYFYLSKQVARSIQIWPGRGLCRV